MIFSSKYTIKRLTVRLYLKPLMGEFTALPRLTGFRGGPGARMGKGKEKGSREIGRGTPLLQEIITTHHWLGDTLQKWSYGWGKEGSFLGEQRAPSYVPSYMPGERINARFKKGLLVNVCIQTFIKRKINE